MLHAPATAHMLHNAEVVCWVGLGGGLSTVNWKTSDMAQYS